MISHQNQVVCDYLQELAKTNKFVEYVLGNILYDQCGFKCVTHDTNGDIIEIPWKCFEIPIAEDESDDGIKRAVDACVRSLWNITGVKQDFTLHCLQSQLFLVSNYDGKPAICFYGVPVRK